MGTDTPTQVFTVWDSSQKEEGPHYPCHPSSLILDLTLSGMQLVPKIKTDCAKTRVESRTEDENVRSRKEYRSKIVLCAQAKVGPCLEYVEPLTIKVIRVTQN